MDIYGNKEVGAFFHRLSDYSRMHLNAARARSGFREIPDMKLIEFQWPDLESPEAAAIWAADPFIAKREALEIALDGEKAGYAFSKEVHETTKDPEIKVLAAEFHIEEAQHVLWIENWLAEAFRHAQ